MIDIDSLEHINSSDYDFDIETSSIIDVVRNSWGKFERDDLLRLGSSLEDILRQKKVNVNTIKKNDNPQYFEKVLHEDYTELLSLKNKNLFPVRSFIIAKPIKSDVMEVLDADVSIILESTHPYFKEFFAYKLATLDDTQIGAFLSYQLQNSFKDDSKAFLFKLQFILADFSRIFGDRKAIIEAIIQARFPFIPLPIDTGKRIATSSVSSYDAVNFDNTNLNSIFNVTAISSFIEVEKYLMTNGYLDASGEWDDTIEILVSLILVLEEKGYFKKRRDKKITLQMNRAQYRKLFKDRYKVTFTNQMQPGQIKKGDLPNKYFPKFEFIQPIKTI